MSSKMAFVPSSAPRFASSVRPSSFQSAHSVCPNWPARFSTSLVAPKPSFTASLDREFAGLSLSSTSSFFGNSFLSLVTTPTVEEDVLQIECMRHQKRLKKLNKPADQRKALKRALVTELLRHGQIKTLMQRAKAIRGECDHIIQLAKRGDLHARRQALGYVYDKQLVHAVFEKAPKRYAERNGGYTRVLRTWPRKGDNAPMAVIELV